MSELLNERDVQAQRVDGLLKAAQERNLERLTPESTAKEIDMQMKAVTTELERQKKKHGDFNG